MFRCKCRHMAFLIIREYSKIVSGCVAVNALGGAYEGTEAKKS